MEVAQWVRFETSLKTNMTDWKIPIFNRKYIFKWWIFHCHVSFRGGNKANVGENVPYETAIWGEGESVTSDVMYISLNTLTNHRFAVDALKMVFLTVMNPMAKKKVSYSHTLC